MLPFSQIYQTAYLSHLHAEFFGHVFAFYICIISQHWNGEGSPNCPPSSTFFYYLVFSSHVVSLFLLDSNYLDITSSLSIWHQATCPIILSSLLFMKYTQIYDSTKNARIRCLSTWQCYLQCKGTGDTSVSHQVIGRMVQYPLCFRNHWYDDERGVQILRSLGYGKHNTARKIQEEAAYLMDIFRGLDGKHSISNTYE